MNYLLIITISIQLSLFSSAIPNAIVNTTLGEIKGKTVYFNSVPVQSFLGIPYAKPPVGELRFKKTVPADQWTGTFHADRLPPACIQYTTTPFPWLDTLPNKKEDCLYLNIWAPESNGSKALKPVMLWLHGGGFRIGSGRIDTFDGRVLAAIGDVIVVTINYRLGPQGFLLSRTEDAPGNMGLYDILETLKWVNLNIEAFGGDKSSVTLFGQSSGAIAAGMLSVSPLARGLFKRIIMQSGAPTNLDAEDNNRNFFLSQALAKAVGCATDEVTLANNPQKVMECMRGVDGLVLVKTIGSVSDNPQRGLYPNYGDELLPRNARQSIIEGDFSTTDVLIGGNSGEGATMITKVMKDVFGFYGEKNTQVNKSFAESVIRSNFKNFSDPVAVVQHYLGDVKDDDYEKIRYQMFTASGDYARLCPSVYFAESFSRKENRVYFYFFTHRPYKSPFAPWMKAIHFDETPFVFGVPLRNPANYTASECNLSEKMIKAWTEFAKYGIPTWKHWPFYSKERPIFQNLDIEANDFFYGLHRQNCEFFRPYFGFQ